MIGNVWEYTRDWWVPGHPAESATDPQGPPQALAVGHDGSAAPAVVIKGGSFLCAPNFCARYRPSARQPQEVGLGASHLGFRTVLGHPPPALPPAEPWMGKTAHGRFPPKAAVAD
jgi:formylglycine-generating enzyme required for sulfatase activity